MMTAISLGKYAAYVWPAYGVTMLGLGLAIFFVVRAHARATARLKALERDAP